MSFTYNFGQAKQWSNIPQKTVSWQGWYKQGGQQHNMNFHNMQIQLGGSVFGSGSDTEGQFNISGTMNHQGHITFTKQYVGQHSVQYDGRLQGDRITGTWAIPGNCQGTFELSMKTERWSGWYEQGGSKQDMYFDVSADNNGVFGIGHDDNGVFVIRGTYNQNSGVLQFVKSYHGKHSVNYQGYRQGGCIQGQWQIPGNSSGTFQLSGGSLGSGGGQQWGQPSNPNQPQWGQPSNPNQPQWGQPSNPSQPGNFGGNHGGQGHW